MARRRKGRDISGWLVVDKPAGITSTAVVGRVKRLTDAAKAGHGGTLDPLLDAVKSGAIKGIGAVVGCNNQNDNISPLSPSGAHCSECRVSWGIQKGDQLVFVLKLLINLVQIIY